ncbi:hypothetical protein CEUSTIGMA_g1610.t1 [Chlamydomonas eustigma]|uniref:RAP domain-containing protein n=1 Tax=Chlamydomonas eustigma TaxID=1157962 RepID=A0A250WTL9_9CHLO|nr:hypothetical protein CEUSTIGMA_g1610.t1 [Chlamydomonas eustigma]|eukprot:GAX74161.1 hypothetical protein CEUSTIGMA_g1610.t1 [Chlamydomonas eustigma]
MASNHLRILCKRILSADSYIFCNFFTYRVLNSCKYALKNTLPPLNSNNFFAWRAYPSELFLSKENVRHFSIKRKSSIRNLPHDTSSRKLQKQRPPHWVSEDKVEGALLTFKLVRCNSLTELEELVESRKSAMNTKHIAAFAAKVTELGAISDPATTRRLLSLYCPLLLNCKEEWTFREIAEVLNAHGRVRLTPNSALETALIAPLLQESSDVSPLLMKEGMSGSSTQLRHATSEDLARLASALSMIRRADRETWQALSKACARRMSKFDPRSLASLLRAFSEVQEFEAASLFLEAAAKHALSFLADFSPRDLTHTMLALARLGYKEQDFYAHACDEVRRQITAYTPADVHRALSALLVLQLRQNKRCIRVLAESVQRGVERFPPSMLAEMPSLFQRLGWDDLVLYKQLANKLLASEYDVIPAPSLISAAVALSGVGLKDHKFFNRMLEKVAKDPSCFTLEEINAILKTTHSAGRHSPNLAIRLITHFQDSSVCSIKTLTLPDWDSLLRAVSLHLQPIISALPPGNDDSRKPIISALPPGNDDSRLPSLKIKETSQASELSHHPSGLRDDSNQDEAGHHQHNTGTAVHPWQEGDKQQVQASLVRRCLDSVGNHLAALCAKHHHQVRRQQQHVGMTAKGSIKSPPSSQGVERSGASIVSEQSRGRSAISPFTDRDARPLSHEPIDRPIGPVVASLLCTYASLGHSHPRLCVEASGLLTSTAGHVSPSRSGLLIAALGELTEGVVDAGGLKVKLREQAKLAATALLHSLRVKWLRRCHQEATSGSGTGGYERRDGEHLMAVLQTPHGRRSNGQDPSDMMLYNHNDRMMTPSALDEGEGEGELSSHGRLPGLGLQPHQAAQMLWGMAQLRMNKLMLQHVLHDLGQGIHTSGSMTSMRTNEEHEDQPVLRKGELSHEHLMHCSFHSLRTAPFQQKGFSSGTEFGSQSPSSTSSSGNDSRPPDHCAKLTRAQALAALQSLEVLQAVHASSGMGGRAPDISFSLRLNLEQTADVGKGTEFQSRPWKRVPADTCNTDADGEESKASRLASQELPLVHDGISMPSAVKDIDMQQQLLAMLQQLKRRNPATFTIPVGDAVHQQIEQVLKGLGIQCYNRVQLPGSYFAADMLLDLTGDESSTPFAGEGEGGPENHVEISDVMRSGTDMRMDNLLSSPKVILLEVVPSTRDGHHVCIRGYHEGRIAHFRRLGYEVLVLPRDTWEVLRASAPGMPSKYMASKLNAIAKQAP